MHTPLPYLPLVPLVPLVPQALEIRSVNEKVEYVLNGQHVLSFPLAADIVPVNLDFSAEDLHFQLSLDNWDDWVEKVRVRGAGCVYGL